LCQKTYFIWKKICCAVAILLSLAYGILTTSKEQTKKAKQKERKTMLNGLNFVLAHVPSIAEVLPFYTEKLGFEVETQVPGFVQFKQPNGQGASYALSEEGNVEPKSSTELWWFVDDAEATRAQLLARDIRLVEDLADQPFGRTLTIADPVGNKIYLLQLAQR
jgi:predicted enzyme related to lactoylglutathione lyase